MKVKSIQCKNCAAPISLYGGGHRIRALNCEYCGAVMDAREDYALLAQFSEQYRPDCPLSIGMQGDIKGVSFIIIGMIGLRSNFGDRWTDLHLYSQTHGYAWLTYQLGHFSFTRRVREIPNKNLSNLSPRSTFRVRDKSYLFFEAYQTEITYVAGELTWVAKVGDTSILSDGIAPPFMFSQEEIENEKEYHLTEYMDAESIISQFDINTDKQTIYRSFIHPAQPCKAPIREALSKSSRAPLVLSLLLLLGLSLFASGKTVLSESFSNTALSSETLVRDFTINNAKHLISIDFKNGSADKWLIKDITLFHEQNEVFAFDRSSFTKPDSTLSEQSGNARFTIPQSGKYSLRMQVTDLANNSATTAHQIRITIKEGVMSNRYFKYLFYFSLIGFLLWHIKRFLFENQRWAMSN